MQSGMALSREKIGHNWDNTYMVAPVWRFYLQSGVIDSNTWCGIFFPSTDRVGRHFPFSIFFCLEQLTDHITIITQMSKWFDQLENIGLQLLDPSTKIEKWSEVLNSFVLPPLPPSTKANEDDVTIPIPTTSVTNCSYIILGDDLESSLKKIPNASTGKQFSYWWRSSEENPGKIELIASEQLPIPEHFPAMLGESAQSCGFELDE